MQEKKITVKICHQNFYSLFQRIEWHPNPTDFELCTMKGKSKVSLLFVYLNQFDHYTRIAVNLLQFNPELYYNTIYYHILHFKESTL